MVLSGKDKGKKGKVLKVMPFDDKAIVERINVVKKHNKPSKKIRQAGIVDIEAPIFVSKLMLVCSKCSKPTRIGKKYLDDQTKVRVCKKCGAEID